MENIILVDNQDKEIGSEEKLAVHQKGLLHRAFSIFIFNSKNQLLLQKRARGKYHSGGSWSNTCCSHPRSGESIVKAAHRRLKEEMSFDCPLKKIGSFIYSADFGDLKENEFDHVLVGTSDLDPSPNSEEVEDWRWFEVDKLISDLELNPTKYSAWLKPALEIAINHKL